MTVVEAPPVVEAVGITLAHRPATENGRLGAWGVIRIILFRVGSFAFSVGFLLLVWIVFLKALHVDPFIGRTPIQVWRFLTTDTGAAANRTQLRKASITTLTDAGVGLIAGTIAALVASSVFILARGIERSLMPIALVLSSVPLVAMTPLITLIFGRGLMGVTVIAGIVTFFPMLVNVSLALKGTPTAMSDLCAAYGAGPVKTLWKVQYPNALPALFASLRIAAPLALIGALLAEWLATGKGLGYLMLQSQALSTYSMLWSATALVTIYSIVVYSVISAIEK
ncbi:MAG: binding-protein-dependent transport system inner rane component, partial [Actinomycetia bacterium]|nr:binding-protein-dependent transport system inner rane component [Actinomycetes bacterium]